jgi:hypothetical protein
MLTLNKKKAVVVPKSVKLTRVDLRHNTPPGYLPGLYVTDNYVILAEATLAKRDDTLETVQNTLPAHLHLEPGLPTVRFTTQGVRVEYWDGKRFVTDYAAVLDNGARISALYRELVFSGSPMRQKDKNSPLFITKGGQVLAVIMPLETA